MNIEYFPVIIMLLVQIYLLFNRFSAQGRSIFILALLCLCSFLVQYSYQFAPAFFTHQLDDRTGAALFALGPACYFSILGIYIYGSKAVQLRFFAKLPVFFMLLAYAFPFAWIHKLAICWMGLILYFVMLNRMSSSPYLRRQHVKAMVSLMLSYLFLTPTILQVALLMMGLMYCWRVMNGAFIANLLVKERTYA